MKGTFEKAQGRLGEKAQFFSVEINSKADADR